MSNRAVLKEVFGFDEFRDKQEDVIELVLQGQSCLYVMMMVMVMVVMMMVMMTLTMHTHTLVFACV